MIIVHVVCNLHVESDGVREVVLNLSRNLQNSTDHKIIVIGPRLKSKSFSLSSWAGIDVRCFDIIGPKSFLFSFSLLSQLINLNPDVVHLHGIWSFPSWAVLRLHKISKCVLVVSPHGMLSKVALSYSRLKKLFVSKLFVLDCLESASCVHVTCKEEEADVLEFCQPKSVVLVPNGVEISPRFRSDEPVNKTVLSLGRIHKKKGLPLLLQAWKQLEVDFPSWDLIIAGPDEGGELSRLKSLSNSLGLSRCVFIGPVYGDEKHLLFSNSSVFVLSSFSENFALSVAESLASGVPVVSTKGAPWSGLIDHKCGVWVDISISGLRDGLSSLMSLSESERTRMGLNGRNWMISNFSWACISREFICLYSSLTGLRCH